MSVTVTIDDFLEKLEQSHVIAADQVAAIEQQVEQTGNEDAIDVATQLVKGGVLTRFQAEEILNGRHRRLRIDDLVLTNLVGVGGMGAVYRALDESGQPVAVKVLSETLKHDTGMRTRFDLEAKAGMKVDDPRVLKTMRIGQTDDVFGEVDYVVMELFEGIALHELVSTQGRLAYPRACDIIVQAAQGLAAVHRAGMIHRDVKPDNLLVNAEGDAKVLDFGLALVNKHEPTDEFSLAMIFGHDCLGTADYMPPEQADDSLQADIRSDIYGLGCTLYVALAAHRPFSLKGKPALIEAHRNEPVPTVTQYASEVPPELDAIIQKMMAKDPADRFQTMEEVAAALAPFAKHSGVRYDFSKVLKLRLQQAKHRSHVVKVRTSSRGGSTPSAASRRRSTVVTSGKVDNQVETSTGLTGIRQKQLLGTLNDESEIEAGSAAAAATKAVSDLTSTDVKGSIADLPPQQRAEIVFLDGRVIPADQPSLVIGRSRDCDITLDIPALSGQHCELRFDGEVWRIVDLGSKNRFQVNGRPVKEVDLSARDIVTLPDGTTFRMQYSGGPAKQSKTSRRWVIAATILCLLAIAGGVVGLWVW